MSKLDVVPTTASSTAAPTAVDPLTLSALETAGGLIEILGTWQKLVKKMVFPSVTLTDAKAAKCYQKRLMSQRAMSVLMLIWRESDLVSDAEVEAAQLSRLGSACSPINCHNLAKSFAADPYDVDRQEKMLQGIVAAAEAYGLLERKQFSNSRQRPLRGTEALHRLVLAVDQEVRPICADIAASGPGGL